MYERINGIIATFEEETKNLEPEQKFIPIVEADANYIASQVRNILNVQIGGRRGRGVASRINITVDTRRNEICHQRAEVRAADRPGADRPA